MPTPTVLQPATFPIFQVLTQGGPGNFYYAGILICDPVTGEPISPSSFGQQVQLTANDKSNKVFSGGVAQIAIPANPARIGWMISNLSTDVLYIRDDGQAATTLTAVPVSPGQTITDGGRCTQAAISVLGATTGDAYSAKEYTITNAANPLNVLLSVEDTGWDWFSNDEWDEDEWNCPMDDSFTIPNINNFSLAVTELQQPDQIFWDEDSEDEMKDHQ